MGHYQHRISDLEEIRSQIKHLEPGQVDLERIRGFLGWIRWDLEVLAMLRRPDTYTLQDQHDGTTAVTITIVTETSEAEDLVRSLWLETDPVINDGSPSGAPTPPSPAVQPPVLPE
jgi:hypothetical protein